jgi:hypothetical protein
LRRDGTRNQELCRAFVPHDCLTPEDMLCFLSRMGVRDHRFSGAGNMRFSRSTTPLLEESKKVGTLSTVITSSHEPAFGCSIVSISKRHGDRWTPRDLCWGGRPSARERCASEADDKRSRSGSIARDVPSTPQFESQHSYLQCDLQSVIGRCRRASSSPPTRSTSRCAT